MAAGDGFSRNPEQGVVLNVKGRSWRKRSNLADETAISKDLAAVFYIRQIEREGIGVGRKGHAEAIPADAAVTFVALLGPGLAGVKQRPGGIVKPCAGPRGVVTCVEAPGPGSVVMGTWPLTESIVCARTGRMVSDTTVARMKDCRRIAERGDDFMRGGQMQGEVRTAKIRLGAPKDLLASTNTYGSQIVQS
jgi:hypothetical protein